MILINLFFFLSFLGFNKYVFKENNKSNNHVSKEKACLLKISYIKHQVKMNHEHIYPSLYFLPPLLLTLIYTSKDSE